MNVRIDVLDERMADCVAGWLHSRADVMLFGGARLPFPLTGRDLLATSDDGCVVLAMKVDDMLVASGSYKLLASGRVRIGRIIVAPACRGRGLGRATVIGLMETATRAVDASVVELGVYQHNTNAINLYESLGFCQTRVGATTTIDGKPFTGIEMEYRVA